MVLRAFDSCKKSMIQGDNKIRLFYNNTNKKYLHPQKEFPGAKGYSAANLWRMRYFY